MKGYLISDLPADVSAGVYDHAVQHVVSRLKGIPGCKAVYGIGGVSAPGISDLDIVVVAADGIPLKDDFRASLSRGHRYLFIHDLYGASEQLFHEGQRFTFFRPYRLLAGEDMLFGANFEEPDAAVRKQVALEYLIRFYLSISMQREYRLLRVRSVLLNAKGAAIDIKYLAPTDLDANRFMLRLQQLRTEWFTSKRPPVPEFVDWFNGMHDWFVQFLKQQFQLHPFFLPGQRKYALGRNINLVQSTALGMKAKAVRMNALYPLFGRKYFKLLNRFSRFDIQVPYTEDGIPQPVLDYFDYNQRHRAYNALHLPHCLPLTSSFNAR